MVASLERSTKAPQLTSVTSPSHCEPRYQLKNSGWAGSDTSKNTTPASGNVTVTAARSFFTSISPKTTSLRAPSSSPSPSKNTWRMRQAKRCWSISRWSWSSPSGIDAAASSVHGPGSSMSGAVAAKVRSRPAPGDAPTPRPGPPTPEPPAPAPTADEVSPRPPLRLQQYGSGPPGPTKDSRRGPSAPRRPGGAISPIWVALESSYSSIWAPSSTPPTWPPAPAGGPGPLVVLNVHMAI